MGTESADDEWRARYRGVTLARFIADDPAEWWLWPYVTSATDVHPTVRPP